MQSKLSWDHEAGTSANAQPLFPWKERYIATLWKPKALVSMLGSHCRKTGGYLERKQLQKPPKTPRHYAQFSPLPHPKPPTYLPDLTHASGRSPTRNPCRLSASRCSGTH